MAQSRIVGARAGRSRVPGKPAKEAAYKHVAVAALPGLVPRTYGLRASGDSFFFPGGQREYFDQFGFASGRALVMLYTLSDRRPLSTATERRLLSLLYSRAQAHEL